MADEDFQLGEVQAPLDGKFSCQICFVFVFSYQSFLCLFAGTSLESACDQFPFCPSEPTRYRTENGQCNNPAATKSAWGAAGSPMYGFFFSFSFFNQIFRISSEIENYFLIQYLISFFQGTFATSKVKVLFFLYINRKLYVVLTFILAMKMEFGSQGKKNNICQSQYAHQQF